MLKRLMICLVAVGLAVIFTAEAADAHGSRLRRSVEEIYEYNTTGHIHLWNGATYVDSRLFGAAIVAGVNQAQCEAQDGYWDTGTCYTISCEMTGTLVCEGGACATDYQIDIDQDSFSITLPFREGVASGVSVLDPGLGAVECSSGGGTYADYLPNAIVVLNEFHFSVSDGRPPVVTLDMCPDYDLTDGSFNCVGWWNSVNGLLDDPAVVEPMPKTPCCGDPNTLYADVEPEGAGTVTSVPAGINCDGTSGSDCDQEYGNEPPAYDTCPEITLTALTTACEPPPGSTDPPDTCYDFTGWSGGNCDGSLNPICVTTAEGSPTETANYGVSCVTLTVTADNADANDRVRIFRPSGLLYDHPAGENICDREDSQPCWVQFCGDEIGTRVTVKKQGDDITWGGDCEGVPNSFQCSVTMDISRDIIVNFE